MRVAPFSIAALNADTDAPTTFCVTTCGETTDSPSYGVAAQW
jgi:hypothetical protein